MTVLTFFSIIALDGIELEGSNSIPKICSLFEIFVN